MSAIRLSAAYRKLLRYCDALKQVNAENVRIIKALPPPENGDE